MPFSLLQCGKNYSFDISVNMRERRNFFNDFTTRASVFVDSNLQVKTHSNCI